MAEGSQLQPKRPWSMVRRDGSRATTLVNLLDAHGLTLRGQQVTGRKLEELSMHGLLPEEDASDEQVLGHFRALDALGYGPGKSADETSLRLLVRGFGTEGARFSIRTWLDEVFNDRTKHTWDELVGARGVGPIFKRFLDACSDVPEGGRETYNGVLLRETPDTRKAGFMQNMVGAGSGEGASDPELVNDVARQVGPNPKRYERRSMPDEIEKAEGLMDQLARAFRQAPEVVASVSLTTLAMWATITKSILSLFDVPKFDPRDREVLSARMAPLFLSMVQEMAGVGWEIDVARLQALRAMGGGDPTS